MSDSRNQNEVEISPFRLAIARRRGGGIMLGLEGYGSGTDDDDDDVGDNATRGRVTLLTDDAPPAEARAPSPPPSAKPAEAPNFAAALPPPKVTTGSLFASLPAPGAGAKGAKRVVAFRPPLKTDALGEDSEEDEEDEEKARVEKTRRGGGAGAPPSLASLLPKPVNVSRNGDLVTGGVLGGGGALGGGGGTAVDLGESKAAARERDEFNANELDDVAAGPAPHPSRAYATDERGEYLYASYDAREHDYGQPASSHGNTHQKPSAENDTRGFDVDDALAAALAAERARGNELRFAVRETNMASLRGDCGDSETRAAFDPASVLGEEHREKLAREAGAKPSAAHKSKNQIGSLLYEAKQAELKILEGRLAGTSHKAAAKRKYGW
jgi:proline-rich protein PRCC